MATHIYSVSVNYNIAGQFASNILHYQFDDSSYATTATAAQQLLLAVQTQIETKLSNCLSSDSVIMGYKGRCLNQPGGFESVVLIPGGTAGTRPSVTTVAGIGPVIVFMPTANGKLRGRMFVPSCPYLDMVCGYIGSVMMSHLATLGTALIGNVTLAGGATPTASPVIYTRKPVKLGTAIQHFKISPMLGQIRRRQVPV
jgi:hypothetical protein